MKYLLIAGSFLCCITGNSQHNALYDRMPMGKYAVGFKIFTITDSLRVSKPLYNYFGEKETGDRHRKILIHLWYPAKPNTGGQVMDYATYATNAELSATNDVIPPDRKAIILNNSRENFQNFFGDMKDEDWKRVKETKFLSHKEAIPATGKFPLLIGMLRHFSTTVTNEMLASNGYIVAMVDGAGMGYPIGYPIEIADMQQTINHLSRSFSIDQDNLGSFGFSGSGFTQVVFAMIDERVRALADLESGLYMEGLWQQLSASNFYNDQRLKIPFLHLFSKDLSREEKYLEEFEKKLKYSERYRVLMNQPGLHHWDFATEGRVSTTLVHLRREKEPGIRACYELANLYLLHYFNAILKNDASSRAFLEKKQAIAGYADSSWSYFRYPALKAPPDKSQFAEFIDHKGIDSAVALARDIFRRDSSAEFLHENILNQLSYTYRRIQKIKEAIALLRLAAEFHPDKAWVWNNLASIEEDYGDKKEAVLCSQKVVDLLGNGKGNEPSFDERVKKSAIERIDRLKVPD